MISPIISTHRSRRTVCAKVPLVWCVAVMGMIIMSGTGCRRMEWERNSGSPFGVLAFLSWNHSWNRYHYEDEQDIRRAVKLMSEAGMGFVRMDFYWEDIEPQQGDFRFQHYDTIVRILKQHNIRIVGMLHYSAQWASSCGEWNCAPKDNRLFVNYATRVIERYRGTVKHWEIWNEPDSHLYWKPQDGLKGYTRLLKEVYRAAKRVDPECVILNGGLSKGLSSVNRLYDNGAGEYFDVLNIHIFESPVTNPAALKTAIAYAERAYAVMSRRGDAGKRIWITEMGIPGVDPALGVRDWWAGRNPTEHEQAQWVKDIYSALTDYPYVEKIFWAFYRDTDRHWNDGADYLGLIRHDFSLKPAYKAYQWCYRQWLKKKQIP